jgi:cytosine permease
LLAVAGILDVFVTFLVLLGVIIPPIAAIYVIDAYFGVRGRESSVRWQAVATWLASTGIALAAYAGWYSLTTVPAADATLAAILIHAGQTFYGKRRPNRGNG